MSAPREVSLVHELASAAAALRDNLRHCARGAELAAQLAPLYPPESSAGYLAGQAAQLIAYGMWGARCLSPDAPPSAAPKLVGQSSLVAEALMGCLSHTLDDPALRGVRERLQRVGRALPAAPDALLEAYEPFLAAYDPAQRRSHGVYFTPPAVVDFILDGVEQALREQLGLQAGLGASVAGDGKPLGIVDPAAGTGAFLVRLVQRAGRQAHRLAARLHGFELLPVPYVICHLQLALQLAARGEPPGRLHVYLASALEDHPVHGVGPVADALRRERSAAAQLRLSQEIAVVVGNPPYRRGSTCHPGRRRELLEAYTKCLSGEPNVQPLSDDYVLFLRSAELWIRRRRLGVAGLITPSSFLSGRLYRGMREQLRQSFHWLEITDLRGSVRARAARVRGLRDENIFGVAQGVAVSVLARGGPLTAPRHRSLHGSRAGKLQALSTLRATSARDLACAPPLFLFEPAPTTPASYAGFVPLDELFSAHSVGGKPGDDGVLVGFEPEAVVQKVQAAARQATAGTERPKTEAGVKLVRYLATHPAAVFSRHRVAPYAYRPFDVRYCYDEPALWTRPVLGLRARIDGRPLLLVSRVVKDAAFAHAFVSRLLPDVIALSATSSVNCHVFPMAALELERARRVLGFEAAAETLFGYLYGVLHSPRYRARCLGALRHDYPRIPLTPDRQRFAAVARLGEELVALHLEDRQPDEALRPRYVDGGDRRVLRVGDPARTGNRQRGGAVHINDASYFEPVPLPTFRHRIGGYQVCRKWLDDRRRAQRSLSDADVEKYRSIVAIVTRTRALMVQLDALVAPLLR